GGAERIDWLGGAPDLNCADGGEEPFVAAGLLWPSVANAPESEALPPDGGGGGELRILSMLARSGSGAAGVVVTEGALFSLSLSKTCVASSSSSQSMSSLPPFLPFAFAAAGCGAWEAEPTTPAGPGRVLAGAGIG